MQVVIFIACVLLALVVFHLLAKALGWLLRIGVFIAVTSVVVVVGGLFLIWILSKLLPVLIALAVLAVVCMIVVAVRFRSRFRHTPLCRSADRGMAR